VFFNAAEVRDTAFFGKDGTPVARDGTVPFARWVVRRKGVVELGSMGAGFIGGSASGCGIRRGALIAKVPAGDW
jgi:hypothetical protein